MRYDANNGKNISTQGLKKMDNLLILFNPDKYIFFITIFMKSGLVRFFRKILVSLFNRAYLTGQYAKNFVHNKYI